MYAIHGKIRQVHIYNIFYVSLVQLCQYVTKLVTHGASCYDWLKINVNCSGSCTKSALRNYEQL